MAAKLPRLTRNRHGTFTLRWIVPVHLRERVGVRREIKVSLRTTDPIKARILALELNLELERLRASMSKDPSDIRRLINPMVLKLGGGVEADIRTDDDLRLFQSLLNQNPELREGLMQRIRRGEDPGHATAALVQEMRQAYGGGHNVARPTTMAKAVEEFAKGANTGSAAVVELGSRNTAGEKLRTLTLLLDDLVAHGGADREAICVHEIKRADVKGFIDRHAKRPSKAARGAIAERKRAKKEATLLITEAIEPSGAEQQTVSSRTIKKAIGHLTDFFVQALANEWIALSPIDEAFEKATAQYRVISGQEKRRNHYELFEEAEIQTIFEPVRYLSKLNASDDFWVPLLALFTGARAGELVGLRVADVMFDKASQLWFIDISEELNDHDGPKTSNSVRRIPIAAALVELGFLAYVEKLREAGARELFPHRPLNKTRKNDPSKHISRVFSEHLSDAAVKTAKKVFHSFRHTVITRMHVRGVPVADAELVVGHAAQDAELRQQAARSTGGSRGGTHLGTYVNAAGFADASKPLLERLYEHINGTLNYGIDHAGLTAAAAIVNENTVKKGASGWKSGWHANNRVLAQAMADRVANACTRSSDASDPAALASVAST